MIYFMIHISLANSFTGKNKVCSQYDYIMIVEDKLHD